MYSKFMDNLSKNPLLYLLAAVLSTGLVTLMSSSYATISHVDREVKNVKDYVNDKHKPIKEDITEIKASVKNVEAILLKILLKQERENVRD